MSALIALVVTFCLAAPASGDTPATLDTDGDALLDIDELELGTDPADPDTDNDRMPDGWEVANGLDPLSSGATTDSDDDGLLDPAEFVNATDPGDPDTDDDLMADGWEIQHDFDPLIDDGRSDRDGGGASNREEFAAGTNPDDPADDVFPQPDVEPPATAATIEGTVFVDVDRDSVIDAAEADLSGVRVELVRDGELVASTVTASPFVFADIPTGDYTIRIDPASLPVGQHPTGATSQEIAVGESPIDGLHFGANFALIAGTIADDAGHPVPNARVEVIDRAGTSFATTSDSDGRYAVEGSDAQVLVLGRATIRVALDDRWESTSIDVTSGATTQADLALDDPAVERPAAPSTASQPATQPAATMPAPPPPVLALTGNELAPLALAAVMAILLGMALIRLSQRRVPGAELAD